jgi:D-alanyl-D-alanine dipeptidase
MVAEGFIPLPNEWWHFDWQGWQRYPIMDQPLI